jgi:hypothetical protein
MVSVGTSAAGKVVTQTHSLVWMRACQRPLWRNWEYNDEAASGRFRGTPIERENFVIMEAVPLNRMLSVLFLRKNLNQKDWDSFLEVYGIPSVFLVGPASTLHSKEKEYQRIAEEIISDGRGYQRADGVRGADGGCESGAGGGWQGTVRDVMALRRAAVASMNWLEIMSTDCTHGFQPTASPL